MLRNRSIPACTVIPVLAYPALEEAITFLCDTFDFTLRLRIADHRAQLNVGDAAVVVIRKEGLGHHYDDSIMIRVENVDRHYENARLRGARIVTPPADYPYGERQYSVQDLVGREWTFSQSIRDVHPDEWGGTAHEI